MQDERAKTLAKNPPSPEARAHFRGVSEKLREAERLLEQDDVRGAVRAADEALRRAGGLPTGLLFANSLAPIYMRAANYEKAASLFGFKADPNNLSLNAAIAFVMTRRFGEARKSYREAQLLAYHPEFKPYLPDPSDSKNLAATLFLARGYSYYNYRKYGSAVWALGHASAFAPRNPLVLCCYAEALAKRGRKPEARRNFEASVRLDGNGTIARRARAGLVALKRSAL